MYLPILEKSALQKLPIWHPVLAPKSPESLLRSPNWQAVTLPPRRHCPLLQL